MYDYFFAGSVSGITLRSHYLFSLRGSVSFILHVSTQMTKRILEIPGLGLFFGSYI